MFSSRARAQKKIKARNARDAKAIANSAAKAADQAKIEQLKALKEWVEGDLNRELAMLRTVRLRGRKMRRKVQRLQRVYLATGADPNEVEPGKQAGTTCLMHAAMGGHLEIVEMLLQFGADHTTKNLMRETALSLAVARNFTPVALRLLEEEGALVDSVDVDGVSVLSHAARNNNIAVARVLLDKGASQFLHRDKHSPLEIAQEKYEAAAGDKKARHDLEPLLELLSEHYEAERVAREKAQFEREDKLRAVELEYWRQKEEEKRRGARGAKRKAREARLRRGRVVPSDGDVFDLDEELEPGKGRKGASKKNAAAVQLEHRVLTGRRAWQRDGKMVWIRARGMGVALPGSDSKDTAHAPPDRSALYELLSEQLGYSHESDGLRVESNFCEIVGREITKQGEDKVTAKKEAEASVVAALDYAKRPALSRNLNREMTADQPRWKAVHSSLDLPPPTKGLYPVPTNLRKAIFDESTWRATLAGDEEANSFEAPAVSLTRGEI